MGAAARGDGHGRPEADDPGRAAGGDDVRPFIVGEELWFQARWDEFWDFVAERQRIWERRVLQQQPWPWTSDFILLRQHFSNAYRDLDPTSDWIYRNCIQVEESPRDRIFNVLLHRMIGRHETSEHVGFWLVDEFDVNRFRIRINEVVSLTDGGLIVAPGFQPYGRRGTGGHHLPSALASVVAKLADDWDAHLPLVTGSVTAAQLFQNLQRFKGFGPFLAYQVFQDLCRGDRQATVALVGELGWDNALAPIVTADVSDAIETLTGVSQHEVQDIEVFKVWLSAPRELEIREFPWWVLEGIIVYPNVRDILACLHNYSRYRRYKNSLRVHRLTYRPPEMRTRRKR